MTRKAAIPRTPIGRRLQFARREIAKITQDELAMLSGVDRTSISRIESGFTEEPFRDTVDDLSEAMSVRAEWLRGEGDVIRPGLCFVYALHGHDRPLFVGVCTNLPGQLERHRRTSSWAREVARVDHLPVIGMAVALAVRDQWVAQLIPVWNVREAAEASRQDKRTNLVRKVG
jgi:transcriptional regulator with XRE-family HTH domain